MRSYKQPEQAYDAYNVARVVELSYCTAKMFMVKQIHTHGVSSVPRCTPPDSGTWAGYPGSGRMCLRSGSNRHKHVSRTEGR